MMKLFLFISSVLVLLNPNGATSQKQHEEPPKLVRSFTLTPGYMERTFNSNDMMKHGPLSCMQLYSKGTDTISNISNDVITRLGIFGLCLIPNFFLSQTNQDVYHEFGHARAYASMGYKYSYYASSDSNLPTDYAYGFYLKRIQSPSAFISGAGTAGTAPENIFAKIPSSLFKRIMTPKKKLSQKISQKLNTWWKNPGAVNEKNLTASEKYVLNILTLHHTFPLASPFSIGSVYTSETEVEKTIDTVWNGSIPTQFSTAPKTRKEYIYDIIKELISKEAEMVVDIAGINNQMQYSQEISNLIFKHNGHQMYFFDYMFGKREGYHYASSYGKSLEADKVSSGNDISNILHHYDNRDYNINASDIKIGSLASLFLSATTWSFVYSAITELPKGSFFVHAPVWHGWRLPDLNFYMTSQGLSFEIVTGYQFNENWYAGLTAEMVYKGNTAYEFGPSIGYKFNTPSGEFELSAQAIIGKNMEFGGNAGVEWTSSNKDWTVGVKYIYHNALTLVGERNIPFLCSGFMNGGEPSHTNHEANITVSYNY
ncbi:MAG: hypothetical protein Q8Q56_04850 [Alphaproteobacteria bacterium]|nr:hypothetical protein [Alphaproteobacteria bacterium]